MPLGVNMRHRSAISIFLFTLILAFTILFSGCGGGGAGCFCAFNEDAALIGGNDVIPMTKRRIDVRCHVLGMGGGGRYLYVGVRHG